MADVTLNIRHNADQATSSVKSLSNAMGSFASKAGLAAKAGLEVASGFSKIGKAIWNVSTGPIRKAISGFSKLTSSIGRIAFYRAIRSAIRYVTDSFKQGLDAAYNWSKQQGGANAKLAGAMDALSAASGRMKLQLGAAFGGLIVAIEPILIRIINLVTQAAEAITRFFAVLNGTGYYKKAAEGFEEVGNSAGGAGKKIKGLLASWDELNVIGKESGGGGGGSNSTDYSGLYEWAEAESDWANLFASGDFFGIGAKIGDALGNISKKITDFLKKPEIQNFGKNLADTLNGLVSDPKNWENFGETVGTFIGTLGNIINDFIVNTNWADVKTALVAFWEGLKAAFDETYSGVDLFGAINILINGWLADLPAKAKNAGIKFTNALITEVENGLNDLIRIYNESFGWLLGNIEPVHFNLIPELPEEELNKNYNSAKKTIEELFKNNPAEAKVTPKVTEPEQKLGPEKFFSHGKVVGEGYAYEIIPQLKEKLNISDWLSGNGSGHNDGVYSTGNGLAVTLSVIPSLGDRSVFVNDMDKNITGKIWAALVNPIYNTGKDFFDNFVKYIIGKVWGARVNPIYNTGKDFFDNFVKYIIGKVWGARVNPIYNSDKTFFETLDKNITGKKFSTTVNPKLSIPQSYKNDVGGLTEEKTVKIKPELTDAKKFKEQLQSALKASASIKTTVSGTTKTIGKVSMSEYAQGGIGGILDMPGQLFVAREAGPELVGTMGGHNAVANNQQIVEGIQSGVAQANSEQNDLLRQQNSILMQLLNKDLTISPSVALGQVMARSAALYGRA